MSVTTLMDAVLVAVAPSKYASALELIPGKRIGLSVAPSVDGKNVDVVVQVNWPFSSVTAGTRMILAVR